MNGGTREIQKSLQTQFQLEECYLQCFYRGPLTKECRKFIYLTICISEIFSHKTIKVTKIVCIIFSAIQNYFSIVFNAI